MSETSTASGGPDLALCAGSSERHQRPERECGEVSELRESLLTSCRTISPRARTNISSGTDARDVCICIQALAPKERSLAERRISSATLSPADQIRVNSFNSRDSRSSLWCRSPAARTSRSSGCFATIRMTGRLFRSRPHHSLSSSARHSAKDRTAALLRRPDSPPSVHRPERPTAYACGRRR